jgi:carbamoyltransferase
MKNILGISAYYHDSAAALVCDGKIIAAAQQERFSRSKHDADFPEDSIRYCLSEAGLTLRDIDAVVFYEKPLIKFERLLETYVAFAPHGLQSFIAAMPVWLKEKLFMKHNIKKALAAIEGLDTNDVPELMFAEHHQSHAASAFYPSPYENAAVLCLDGVGEWATTSAWRGHGNQLDGLWEIHFPHSLGLLYSAFTYYTGFRVNSGEYKLMGLAPYGEPRYAERILDNLIDLKADGTFRLNMSYFNYCTGLTMTNRRFNKLFEGPARTAEREISQREADIAASIQAVTEEVVMRLVRTVHKETGEDYLCLAGGVALNCVSNGNVLRNGPFKDIWIQPAAGDAGGAIGAALVCWFDDRRSVRSVVDGRDSMCGSYLGPRYEDKQIEEALSHIGAVYRRYDDDFLFGIVAEMLAQEKVVGWFQGRMEFGPRALGGRSILGDPRSDKMQSMINMKIKYRESFRPFAPSVLVERVSDYFELDRASPYMLIVADVRQDLRIPLMEDQQKAAGLKKLQVKRSALPAITHVDYSARIQTVHEDTNPRYYRLLEQFEKLTGCGVLVNTSFNVRGEPMVCTPEDAYRCFMRTEMDYLVIENYILAKEEQPELQRETSWMKEFELD